MPGFQSQKPPIPGSHPKKNQSSHPETGQPDFQGSYQRNTHQNKPGRHQKNSSYKPGKAAAILGAALCVSMIATPISIVLKGRSSQSTSSYSVNTSNSGDRDAWDLYELSDLTWFRDGSNIIYTLKVTKNDPDIYAYSSYGYAYLETEDDYDESYFDIPGMDFFTDEVYVSGIFYGNRDYDPHITYSLEDDYVYCDSLEDYSWILDYDLRNEEYSLDDIRQEMASNSIYAPKEIKVIDDGVTTQSGVVVAEVTVNRDPDEDVDDWDEDDWDDGYSEYGEYNIQFLKDGKVIFGDVDSYEFSGSGTNTFRLAYSAPYTLPEYDEVIIKDIN